VICPEPFVLEEGVCRFTVPMTVVDEHGHAVENDYEGRNGCPHGKESPMKGESKQEQGVPTLGHPEPLAGVSEVLAKEGPISGMTVVLVGLVLASGLALKLVPAWLDHKTKKAQVDAKKPDCSSRHVALEEQVKALTQVVTKNDERATIHETRLFALEQKEEAHDP
jgi:hypothetical protein